VRKHLLGQDHDAPFGHAVGFLLSQLGYAVTRRFRAELEAVALEPRHFGLLRAIAAARNLSQQMLGESLQIPASSVVALLDQLENKGLVRRRPDPADRRVRWVELTDAGRAVLEQAIGVAIGIEEALCAGLDGDQREALIATLQRVAGNIGVTRGVHPAGEETDDTGRAGGPWAKD
jgi:DNA-binding MarR family transcriptional regulator